MLFSGWARRKPSPRSSDRGQFISTKLNPCLPPRRQFGQPPSATALASGRPAIYSRVGSEQTGSADVTSFRIAAGAFASVIATAWLVIVSHNAHAQSVAVASGSKGKVHLLPATLETTQWGWFNNAQPPVLRIDSGDTVVLETMMH